MSEWFELCNLRSSLLHLQFLYCSVQEQRDQQLVKVERSHQDRIMQYRNLCRQLHKLKESNFKRLLILKLESCIESHQADEQVWDLLDDFNHFARWKEQDMSQNLGKVYIGKGVFFDQAQVEQSLRGIEDKIDNFIQKNQSLLEAYNINISQIDKSRKMYQQYLNNVKQAHISIAGKYGTYIRGRLTKRSKEIDFTIAELRKAVLSQ